MTITSVSYNKHDINIYKITVQECKIKPFGYIWFSTVIHKDIKYQIMLSLEYRKTGCVYVVYWMCRGFLFRLSFLFVFSYFDYHLTNRLMQLADSPYPTHVPLYPCPEIYVHLMT